YLVSSESYLAKRIKAKNQSKFVLSIEYISIPPVGQASRLSM
ncbi:unnamed protein product, partial [marine sediment metagenome]